MRDTGQLQAGPGVSRLQAVVSLAPSVNAISGKLGLVLRMCQTFVRACSRSAHNFGVFFSANCTSSYFGLQVEAWSLLSGQADIAFCDLQSGMGSKQLLSVARMGLGLGTAAHESFEKSSTTVC